MKIITFKSNCNNEYTEKYFDNDFQISIISKLFFGHDFEFHKDISDRIKKKITSYRQQDKKMNRNTDNITYEETIKKLLESKLKCHYCKKNVFILYKMLKDKSQWTLDRINNNINHINYNVVVCCLGCNIQRGKKNSQDYLLGKQLQIIKSI